MSATILIVEDEYAVARGIQYALEQEGYQVTVAGSGEEALEIAGELAPDLVVLDVRMPGITGLELQSQLESHDIRLPVIILTGHGDVGMAVKAMKAGALDFIEKPFDDELLLAAIERALTEDVEKRGERASKAEILARMGQLTKREHQVMDMVTSGKSNKEIAAGLGVTAKTVEAHRARVMEKMRAESLAELVRMALIASGEVGT